ncbi:MAG: TAT-variant-translocated molybdopterin oxidoreductase, partial [Candidatus Acidiferrum sp.]
MRENEFMNGQMHKRGTHEASVHEDDHSETHAEDSTVHEHTLDLPAIRAKLRGKAGKQYWRTLEELADDPHFEELLHREFPRQASEWDETVDRRDFLKLAAASLAFAGISGCGNLPEQVIVPYVKQPDGMIPGKPLYYATAMPFGADAVGLLV